MRSRTRDASNATLNSIRLLHTDMTSLEAHIITDITTPPMNILLIPSIYRHFQIFEMDREKQAYRGVINAPIRVLEASSF